MLNGKMIPRLIPNAMEGFASGKVLLITAGAEIYEAPAARTAKTVAPPGLKPIKLAINIAITACAGGIIIAIK